MRLLVLGGTGFLGRHVVEAALEAGHEVTVFNRGRLDAAPLGGVENLRGDRERDLDRLAGRRWDAVIDTCGYVPRVVGAAARALRDAVERYVFVSSIAAYADFAPATIAEDAPLATSAPDTEVVDGETYGPLKAASERALEEELPGRSLLVRPGLIVGPGDETGRFGYWALRLARGGDVLVPGTPERPVQLVDARDVASWLVLASERRETGPFNVAGPASRLTIADLIETGLRVAGSDAGAVWVDPAFLLREGVRPWTEVPLWPAPGWDGFVGIDSSRALAAGLRFRPLEETFRDVLAFERAREVPLEPRLDPRREVELLGRWRAR